ncbi:hypothetical protein PISMIDRAFT_683752 [Pisolithus microcarpus 441]|uniref:Uncharacterized protein n=1 Tax=Pisolithus microcarpus 441 TaxID=765257 RepID=A0A0C9YYB9_9AGAM|nr:hypothetical protein PISMIDRAFT_683752 [Pisolithus microcarpus 441]
MFAVPLPSRTNYLFPARTCKTAYVVLTNECSAIAKINALEELDVGHFHFRNDEIRTASLIREHSARQPMIHSRVGLPRGLMMEGRHSSHSAGYKDDLTE